MRDQRQNRRDFLKTSSAAALTAGTMPYWFTSASSFAYKSANERPVLGCIGTGSRWRAVGPQAMKFADCVALCDVDADHAGKAKEKVAGIQNKSGKNQEIAVHEDYQKVLDRKDIDVVTIVTTDHWHSKIAIEAMQAGKDVYCEKPLTLTIREGQQILKVLNETRRVFQVGTQQRTEMGKRFLQAIAMIRDGRIGKVKAVQCAIGSTPTSPAIPKVDPPKGLNWDKWLGQAPYTDYRIIPPKNGKGWGKSNCHYEFRWWYEYSGGKMTDWGAHHVDIAQWAIDQNGDGQGPIEITPVKFEHPCTMKDGYPTCNDRYNAVTNFLVTCKFAGGVEMTIRSDTDNGILFTGEHEGPSGRFFVNRGKIAGAPVEELKSKPLPDGAIAEVYGGQEPTTHMQNFMDCVKTRETPISDVASHHRAITTCHLAAIACRLGRPIKWDPVAEKVVGDEQAQGFVAREQRKGYEIDVNV